MKTVIAIGVVIVAALLLWTVRYPSGSWRYKMTITVETPEGIKTGSAVREVSVHAQPLILPQEVTPIGVKGEAVVVDLGARGVLFALLRSQDDVDYTYRVFFDMFSSPKLKKWGGQTRPEGIRYFNELKSGSAELPPDEMPEFVRFRDLKDPKTVELVDPNNMAATFGEGVKLVGAKIEITDDPVTTGVEKWLPWLIPLKGRYLGGGVTARTAPLELHGGDFQKGVNNGY